MNSVFAQSGIYSSVVDCLEVSRHLFLPELSKLREVNFQNCCLLLLPTIEIKVEILAAYLLFEYLFGCI